MRRDVSNGLNARGDHLVVGAIVDVARKFVRIHRVTIAVTLQERDELAECLIIMRRTPGPA